MINSPSREQLNTQASESGSPLQIDVAVLGGGPAGLMAAEVLSAGGAAVHLFDAMPSVGRKFLLAGKGGMNLTHAEPFDAFVGRYAEASSALQPMLEAFGAQAVRDWASGLGIDTFVGSSHRVFPTDMKAAPLLRAWLQRLRHPAGNGEPVQFHMRYRWTGWAAAPSGRIGLVLRSPAGETIVHARAVVLALGGASWARLGSDGAWVAPLTEAGITVSPLRPSNCGFDVASSPRHGAGVGWSPFFVERFAGQPFKAVSLTFTGNDGRHFVRRGEFVATASGVEGSLIYAVSARLREEIAGYGQATFHLDLQPDRTQEQVRMQVAHPRGARSLSSHLKSRLGLDGIRMAILNELLDKASLNDPHLLAAAIKALPVTVVAPRPLDEAISTAGGVSWAAMDSSLMLREMPGVFCAGEMLDWEAPTGGYLLTACVSTGRRAGQGALGYLDLKAQDT
ncbi:TIGR03862 family flavoprotein [Hydrogenophaga sp.]|uniref:TIGR03862 family flavoprotein n=1 Tax=Hydrogenophaga sp. TaxID=1904254 RepID=UPI0027171F2F|nr:TIGR03862 family flavoprotein [Hydrogenophaga sp.]MDO8906069.1 TIGR03862 family flavoprotein [Hydrogenophaga sp.]